MDYSIHVILDFRKMLENPSNFRWTQHQKLENPAHNPGWVAFTPPPDPCSPCASLRRRWRSLGASTKVPGPGKPLSPGQLDPLSTQKKVAKDDKSTKNHGVKYHFYWRLEGLKGLSILRSIWSRKVSGDPPSIIQKINHELNALSQWLSKYILYTWICVYYVINIYIHIIHDVEIPSLTFAIPRDRVHGYFGV